MEVLSCKKTFCNLEIIHEKSCTDPGFLSMIAFGIGHDIRDLRIVDLQILETRKNEWEVDETVELKLRTRNVDSIVVKTFEIDTWNFYAADNTALDISVDLEGLSAMKTENFKIDASSAMNHCDWEYKCSIQKRGVFVIEFLGSGKTCRALIRKGGIRAFQRVCSAGHAFKLLYEDCSEIEDAQIRMGGQSFKVHIPHGWNKGEGICASRHRCLEANSSIPAARKYCLIYLVYDP